MNYNDDFLDLREPNLDSKQRTALRVNENAVIAAGAGSGKTQVLATRFAWLIMTGQAKVDEILTLTFTNKAASEMYQRIYKTLSFYAESPVSEKLSQENKERAKIAIDNFSQAHIQTLDSYCGSIVRQAANRYGIKPDFSTGSSDSFRDIKQKAFEFVLKNKDRKGIKTFSDNGKLQEFSEDIFAKTIKNYTSLASDENFFSDKLAIQRNEIIEAYNFYIKGIDCPRFINNEIKSIKSCLSEIEDQYQLLSDKDKKSSTRKNFFENLFKMIDLYNENDVWPNITEENICNKTQEDYKIILDFFTAVKVSYKTKGGIIDIKNCIKIISNNIDEYFTPIINYLIQYDAIKDLFELFSTFLKEINSSKRTSGNLTFNDVNALSLKVLLENEDIRNQEKNAYKKIMIDEFQDNNGKNRDLLYILSLKKGEFESEDGKCVITVDDKHNLSSQIVVRDKNGNKIEDKRSNNKLFFVGDEKQSIYKFRGAEVSVFNELTKGNENLLINMNYNYRSCDALIESFNRLFEGGNGIFDDLSDEKDYEAYYKAKALKNGGKGSNGEEKEKVLDKLTKETVPIHIKLLNISDSKALRETEDIASDKEIIAYNIAKKLSEMGKVDTDWSHFAILDRSRGDRAILIKYLSYFNIPYVVDQVDNIFSDGIINDFYNYFRLCVYPSDKAAFSAYITCPLSGVSINGLEIILSHLNNYAKQNDKEFVAFPDCIEIDEKIKNDLSDKDYRKYCNAKDFFNENRSKTLQNEITTTLTLLWHTKGYKYEALLNQQTELCAEHFDMLFEMGRQADEEGKSVSWLVDQLNLLNNEFTSSRADLDAKGISYPLERKCAVQIMTIHKSKGLQFPHVFIYGITAVKSNGENSKIFYNDDYGVSIKPESNSPNYFYQIGKQLASFKEAAEFRRLIYVAITRAIDDVYIFGGTYNYSTEKNPLRLIEAAVHKFYENPSEDGINFNDNAGFDYEKLKPLHYRELPAMYKKENLDDLREQNINRIDSSMNNAKIIEYKVESVPRNTPSGLEKEKNFEDSDTADKWENSDDILLTANFTAADFGTLVHSYLEAQCNGVKPEEYEAKPSLFKNLSDKEIDTNKNICISMCHSFKNSKLGKELENAKERNDFYRAEWGFRMWYKDSIFTGSIDLIYSNGNGTYTIVDYKSDNKVDPEYYLEQQHCYRAAASKLLHVEESKITLYLYFLKHDRIEKLD